MRYNILDFNERLSDSFAVIGLELLLIFKGSGGDEEGICVMFAVVVKGGGDGGAGACLAGWGVGYVRL